MLLEWLRELCNHPARGLTVACLQLRQRQAAASDEHIRWHPSSPVNSRRRAFCHFAHALSPSLSKDLLSEGGCSRVGQFRRRRLPVEHLDNDRPAGLASDETVKLHTPLPLVDVSTGMERGCPPNDGLADSYTPRPPAPPGGVRRRRQAPPASWPPVPPSQVDQHVAIGMATKRSATTRLNVTHPAAGAVDRGAKAAARAASQCGEAADGVRVVR